MLNHPTVKYRTEQAIAIVTIDRYDEARNAVNPETAQGLAQAFRAFDRDPSLSVAILTGAGGAFCAGFDLKRTATGHRGHRVENGDGPMGPTRMKLSKPVIAAVNGPAVGIGVTMQLAMDIRIASEAARFGFVFSQRGIVPEAASSWFLPRIVGISQALEWCYSGRVFPAQEALAGRLVSKVVPPEDLLPTARALAKEFAAKTAPVSVALIRQMMWRMLGADDPMEAHKVDSRGIYARGRSEDVKEGVVSFLEKRPAQFKNKVSSDMPDYFPWWQERDYK